MVKDRPQALGWLILDQNDHFSAARITTSYNAVMCLVVCLTKAFAMSDKEMT